MTAGILDGKYSSDSFHVKVKASPGPGVPVMALGSVTGNY
jgi:hypothetical protein